MRRIRGLRPSSGKAGRASLRAVALALVVLAAAASSSSESASRGPQAPTGGGPVYACHSEQGPSGVRSQCRPRPEDCEAERGAATSLGLSVSACVPVARVACFQLGGDPSPQAAWCAATHDDCQFWRNIDVAKNGDGGQRCDWR